MKSSRLQQLPLPLTKAALLRFVDFDPTYNPMVYSLLQNWPNHTNMIYLTGPHDSGKTHLAEALAEQQLSLNRDIIFLSGKMAPPIHFFYELPTATDCVIIDDIDALLAFSQDYEEALFALYNQIFDKPQIRLLMTASLAVDQLPLRLKDLRSRLSSMLQLIATPASIDLLTHIIKLHAQRLGIILSDDIIRLIIKDNSENLSPSVCLSTLKKLAEQSLKDQKRLSLAYAKHVLQ